MLCKSSVTALDGYHSTGQLFNCDPRLSILYVAFGQEADLLFTQRDALSFARQQKEGPKRKRERRAVIEEVKRKKCQNWWH